MASCRLYCERGTDQCQQRFASRPKCTILTPQHSAVYSTHEHKIISACFICLHIFFLQKFFFYYGNSTFAIKPDASLSNRCHTISTDIWSLFISQGAIHKVRTQNSQDFWLPPPPLCTQFLWRHPFTNSLACALTQTTPPPSVRTYFMDDPQPNTPFSWTSVYFLEDEFI